MLSRVRSSMLASFLAASMQDFTLDDIDTIRNAIAMLPAALRADRIAATTSPEKQNTLKMLDLAGFQPRAPTSAEDLTFVPMEIGFVSADGTALMGKLGEAYLVSGGNRVLEQYYKRPMILLPKGSRHRGMLRSETALKWSERPVVSFYK